VPAILGYARAIDPAADAIQLLTLSSQFAERFLPLDGSYLADAVRGFFDNGGRRCYAVRLDPENQDRVAALRAGLERLRDLDQIDLVCAPDIMRPAPGAAVDPGQVQLMQLALLEHCDTLGDRFAILDAPTDPAGQPDDPERQRDGLYGTNGALYYPWIKVVGGSRPFVPPCGHIAGVYARTDQAVGVHKAPANEVLVGAIDLSAHLTAARNGDLNVRGINCLRAFAGRGIRVWGARTLSTEPAWTYVSVRRLFLTAGRWIERNLADCPFEPHDQRLWARITREIGAYFGDLFQRGALVGRTPQEAFYVKCDAATNPPATREAGQVVTEIGLAPALPGEFVVVRITHGTGGVTITGPTVS
jgi:hypothetical protein